MCFSQIYLLSSKLQSNRNNNQNLKIHFSHGPTQTFSLLWDLQPESSPLLRFSVTSITMHYRSSHRVAVLSVKALICSGIEWTGASDRFLHWSNVSTLAELREASSSLSSISGRDSALSEGARLHGVGDKWRLRSEAQGHSRTRQDMKKDNEELWHGGWAGFCLISFCVSESFSDLQSEFMCCGKHLIM